MPMWHCPHCGTPQTEAARCWVCRRSSTTCSTCRHFQRSVAAQVGFCGLERRRLPLTGDELRGCWAAGAGHASQAAFTPLALEPASSRLRDFVPVETFRARSDPSPSSEAAPSPEASLPVALLDGADAWDDRVSLFGDEV